MLHSIRWRLVASYVLLTVITFILVGVAALEIVRRYAYRLELEDLRANAQVLAQQAAPLFWPEMRPLELSQLALNASFLGNVRVRILDQRQQVIVDSGLPGEGSALIVAGPLVGEQNFTMGLGGSILVVPPDEVLALDEVERRLLESSPPGTSLMILRRSPGGWGSRFTIDELPLTDLPSTDTDPATTESAASPERSVAQPVVLGGVVVGTVQLSGGPDFGAQAMAAARRALLLSGFGAVLLACLLGLLISRRLSAPLLRLSDAARRMGAGDLSVRAEVGSNDEIGALAARFNQMAESLQASFADLAAERDALKRFVSDASHELRTPITALKNFLTLLQGPASADPSVQGEFLAESQAQVQRLEWITHHLLNLSRLEAGLNPLNLAQADLGDLLAAAAAPFRLPAAEKSVALEVRPPQPPLFLRCDPSYIEMALTNLLDNALKFTPPGGRIEIGAEPAGSGARLWVQDTGSGISAEDLPHIFERFYSARSQPGMSAAAGSGLGLSIVQRIVQAHEGQVLVESQPGQGSRFIILL